jgi:hypothetical protein
MLSVGQSPLRNVDDHSASRSARGNVTGRWGEEVTTVEMVSGAKQSADDSMLDGRRLRIADDVLSRRFIDETLILRLEGEVYFSLDGVGSSIWDLLDQGTSLARVVEVLSEQYEVATSQLEADVRSVLLDLLEIGLIVLVDESSPAT